MACLLFWNTILIYFQLLYLDPVHLPHSSTWHVPGSAFSYFLYCNCIYFPFCDLNIMYMLMTFTFISSALTFPLNYIFVSLHSNLLVLHFKTIISGIWNQILQILIWTIFSLIPVFLSTTLNRTTVYLVWTRSSWQFINFSLPIQIHPSLQRNYLKVNSLVFKLKIFFSFWYWCYWQHEFK